MNRLLLLPVALLVAAFASATDFTTITFVSSDNTAVPPSLGESFTSAGNVYTANFTSFNLSNRPWVDVEWTSRFDTTVTTATSPASPPYDSVTQTVTGRIRRLQGTGSVSVVGALTESVTDLNGSPFGAASAVRTFTGTTDSIAFLPFTLTLNTPFTMPLAAGFTIKDDLIINSDANSEIIVDSISQGYNPVPEPASLAVLGLGALGLLRRRRR